MRCFTSSLLISSLTVLAGVFAPALLSGCGQETVEISEEEVDEDFGQAIQQVGVRAEMEEERAQERLQQQAE